MGVISYAIVRINDLVSVSMWAVGDETTGLAFEGVGMQSTVRER